MKALILSPRACYPPDRGAKLREYHLAKQFSQVAELDLLAFRPGPEEFSLPFCRSVQTLSRPAGYTPTKIVSSLLTGNPVGVVNYHSPEMQQALRERLRATRFDVIVLEALHMMGYRRQIAAEAPSALVVHDWHNIESELMMRYAEQSQSIPHQLYARWTAARLRALEKQMLASRDCHVVCSEREAGQMQRQFPAAQVAVVPNGVDVSAFGEVNLSLAGRRRVLFVGSMDYHPNVEAVEFFASRFWPQLFAQRPDLTFTIVGSSPRESVRLLGQRPGIEVTGTVPRVEPYYAEACVVVVPLFEGGGTRLKIVEAMAAGVPVISTRLGAEGIAVRGGENIILREPEQDWPGAIHGLLDSPESWRELASRGRELASDQYDWRGIGQRFAETVQGWLEARQTT